MASAPDIKEGRRPVKMYTRRRNFPSRTLLQVIRSGSASPTMHIAFATLLLATAVAGDCAADNCLRALRATQIPGRLQSAQSFCATFTKGSVVATAIPTYAAAACVKNQNADLPARISSACSCIAPSTTSASSITSAGATGACALVSSSSSAQRALSPAGMSNHMMYWTAADRLHSYSYRCCSTCS